MRVRKLLKEKRLSYLRYFFVNVMIETRIKKIYILINILFLFCHNDTTGSSVTTNDIFSKKKSNESKGYDKFESNKK
jgi:hypothetical protein